MADKTKEKSSLNLEVESKELKKTSEKPIDAEQLKNEVVSEISESILDFKKEDDVLGCLTKDVSPDVVLSAKEETRIDEMLTELNIQAEKLEAETLEQIEPADVSLESLSKKYLLSPEEIGVLDTFLKELDEKIVMAQFELVRYENRLPDNLLKSPELKQMVENKLTLFLSSEKNDIDDYIHDARNYERVFGISQDFFANEKFNPYRKKFWKTEIEGGAKMDFENGKVVPRINILDNSEGTARELLDGNFNDIVKLYSKEELLEIGTKGAVAIASLAWGSGYKQEDYLEGLDAYQKEFAVSDEDFSKKAIEKLKEDILGSSYHQEVLDRFSELSEFIKSPEAKDLAKEAIAKKIASAEDVTNYLTYFNLSENEIDQKTIIDNLGANRRKIFDSFISRIGTIFKYLSEENYHYLSDEFSKLSEVDQKNFLGQNFGSIGWEEDKYRVIFKKLDLPKDILLNFAKNSLSEKVRRGDYRQSSFEQEKKSYELFGVTEENKNEIISLGAYAQCAEHGTPYLLEEKYIKDKFGLDDFCFNPETEEAIKNIHLKLISKGQDFTLDMLDKYLESKNYSLHFKPNDFPALNEALIKGVESMCNGGKKRLNEFINKYYPYRHKVFLINDPQMKESVSKKLVDEVTCADYLDNKNFEEAIDFFSLDKTQIVSQVDDALGFIGYGKERMLREILPELNTENHNNKWIDVNKEIAVDEAARAGNINFLRILSNRPETAESFNSLIKVQEEVFLNSPSEQRSEAALWYVDNFFDKFSFSQGISEHGKKVLNELNPQQKITCFRKIAKLSEEKKSEYVSILERAKNCPSQEMKRIGQEIMDEIISSDNPRKSYEVIESVFVENNVPLAGKVNKIFNYLHSDAKLEEFNMTNGSPVLKNQSVNEKRETIKSDVGRIHVESGNRSLKKYLKIFQEAEGVFDRINSGNINELTQKELLLFQNALKKLKTIKDNSLGVKEESFDTKDPDKYLELFADLKSDIGLLEGERIADRVAELLLGHSYKNIDEALESIDKVKDEASDRNIQFAKKIKNGTPVINESDFIKGVGSSYISNILQNGSVAKEFLGGSASEDSTPLDTDAIIVTAEDATLDFSQLIKDSAASSYGGIVLILKNRGQYHETTKEEAAKYDDKFETFRTGTIDSVRHYGIRTGLPSSEIDAMVVKQEVDAKRLSFEIAKNGFYIPILNSDGVLIFSPEDYKKTREVFAGVSEYDGGDLRIEKLNQDDPLRPYLEDIKLKKEQEDNETKLIGAALKGAVYNILKQKGLKFRSSFENGIFGAELADTGSTGRLTNMPNDYDYDFAIRLDNADSRNANAFANELKSQIKAESVIVESHGGDYFQLRAKKLISIGGVDIPQGADLDVGFSQKTDEVVYGSHDAVTDKINLVRDTKGEDAFLELRSNIVLTKKILSEAGCYKKLDNGLGGIGVENWILQHGGNLREALTSFKKAAYNEEGKRLPLADFRDIYPIYDPGINIKFNNHDNFMYKLKDETYLAMLEVAKKY